MLLYFYSILSSPPFIYLPYVCQVFSALSINDQTNCAQIKQGCPNSSWLLDLEGHCTYTCVLFHHSQCSHLCSLERCTRWFPFLYLIPLFQGLHLTAAGALQRWDFLCGHLCDIIVTPLAELQNCYNCLVPLFKGRGREISNRQRGF